MISGVNVHKSTVNLTMVPVGRTGSTETFPPMALARRRIESSPIPRRAVGVPARRVPLSATVASSLSSVSVRLTAILSDPECFMALPVASWTIR